MKKLEKKYKDLGLKIFSLFLACVVWIYIHGIVRGGPIAYKDLKDIELRLMGDPLLLGKNVYTVELERKTIDLRVKGPEQELVKITNMDIIAYVDITGLAPGRTYSPVVNCVFPNNIKVVGALPLVRVEIKDAFNAKK
ncbi:MAG: CdaR family protein [Candidatus Omnitrophota bacterium]